MATLNDLELLEKYEPKTFDEWIGEFSDDERDLILESIITARADDVFRVLSKLDQNHYPFTRKTFNGHKRKVMIGE